VVEEAEGVEGSGVDDHDNGHYEKTNFTIRLTCSTEEDNQPRASYRRRIHCTARVCGQPTCWRLRCLQRRERELEDLQDVARRLFELATHQLLLSIPVLACYRIWPDNIKCLDPVTMIITNEVAATSLTYILSCWNSRTYEH